MSNKFLCISEVTKSSGSVEDGQTIISGVSTMCLLFFFGVPLRAVCMLKLYYALARPLHQFYNMGALQPLSSAYIPYGE